MNSMITTLAGLYTAAIIGGVGAGAVYGTAVGNSLKWFTDRRGLAAGLTAAGFGFGSAFTVQPIADLIRSSGYQSAFFRFGILQGVVVMLCALALRAPRAGEVPAITVKLKNKQTARDFTARRVAEDAHLLGDVRDVRHGGHRRADGGGAAGAHREGLQGRGRSGHAAVA